jgi:DNA-binding MarR family transcriptional regulator
MNALRRIVRSLRNAGAESEAALGVTPAQLFVMRVIAKEETLTVGELAARTATAQSSVSEVVARLLARGHVVRRKSSIDRRRTEISLSESGRALIDRAPQTVQETLLAAFARLPVECQRDIATGLRSWVEEAGFGRVEATMFFEPTLET